MSIKKPTNQANLETSVSNRGKNNEGLFLISNSEKGTVRIRIVSPIPKSFKELSTRSQQLAFGSIEDTSQKKRIDCFVFVNDNAQALRGMKKTAIQSQAGIGEDPGSVLPLTRSLIPMVGDDDLRPLSRWKSLFFLKA